MAVFFSESEVEKHLTVWDTTNVLDEAFRLWRQGQAVDRPRDRIRISRGLFHTMTAAIHGLGVHGLKTYTSGSGKFLVHLYDSGSGELLALLEGNHLGQIRTGAASGLATRYMAREDASSVACIGTGFQAETQLEAVCKVRPIHRAFAYSRTKEHREAFASRMGKKLGIEVTPVESGEACVSGVDIINVVTNSREPVLNGAWLSQGQHINAAGSNHWMRRELDTEAVTRADAVVVDSLSTAQKESGELIWAAERGTFRWEQVRELRDVVGGVQVRTDRSAVTLFESQGLALEDVAAANYLYRKVGDQMPALPF